MTVKFYEFGQLVGGTSPDGPIAPAAASYGIGESFEGTVAVVGTTITLANPSKHITIKNTHDSAALEYSFDAGVTWLSLGSYGEIGEFINLTSLMLRRVGAAVVTYEVVAIEVE